MEQINILKIIRPSDGGIKEHIKSLLKYLNSSKFKICVVCDNNTIRNIKQYFKDKPNITFIPIVFNEKNSFLSNLQSIYSLIKLLRNTPFDIIHCHGLKAAIIGGIAARTVRHENIIYTAHSNISFKTFQIANTILYKTAEKTASHISRQIIAVSEGMKSEMIMRNIPAERITVIPNGIDANKFKIETDKKRIKVQLGIPEETNVVGTVARLAPQKNLETFLKGASILLSTMPELMFIIVGDGPLKKQLQDRATELGIKNKVIFTGYRSDIPEILHIMDVFALSSWTEGLPITVLEAMAAEKPVVATRVGGTPEIIKDGLTGLLVEPYDAEGLAEGLVRILSNHLLADALGTAARKSVVENYTIEKMVKSTEKVYSDLITKRRQYT